VPGERPHAALDVLGRGQWFASLPESLRAAIVSALTIRAFAPGEAIIRQGRLPRGLCALIEGRARMTKLLASGREVLIQVGGPGTWFGDWSVLADRPALNTTSAVTRCRVAVLPMAEFRRLVDEEPRWYREFNRYLLDNVATYYEAHAAHAGLSAEGWLRHRLAAIAEVVRRNEGVEGPVALGVSQSELATAVGLSRPALNGMLARLQRRGLLELRFRQVVVVDEAALRRVTDADDADSRRRPARR
jgi:CRP-like cAMP-binding protein